MKGETSSRHKALRYIRYGACRRLKLKVKKDWLRVGKHFPGSPEGGFMKERERTRSKEEEQPAGKMEETLPERRALS